MLDYLKYKLKRLPKKAELGTQPYPLFYEQQGLLIREDEDGKKYEIELDKNNKPRIVRELTSK